MVVGGTGGRMENRDKLRVFVLLPFGLGVWVFLVLGPVFLVYG